MVYILVACLRMLCVCVYRFILVAQFKLRIIERRNGIHINKCISYTHAWVGRHAISPIYVQLNSFVVYSWFEKTNSALLKCTQRLEIHIDAWWMIITITTYFASEFSFWHLKRDYDMSVLNIFFFVFRFWFCVTLKSIALVYTVLLLSNSCHIRDFLTVLIFCFVLSSSIT